MHWPAGMRGGQRRSELVSVLDAMPTALDAAGVEAPRDLDGHSVLPLTSGKARKVHDHLLWAGIHARSWGFLRGTTIGEGNPERRREESPGAWVVTDGRYLLRFVTTIPAGLFKDVADGAPAAYELYDLREDPLERMNLYDKLPQVARELRTVYEKQAASWPPPSKWRKDRWREMVPPNNKWLKQPE
jgi:arylsulfatase A-like enzyme